MGDHNFRFADVPRLQYHFDKFKENDPILYPANCKDEKACAYEDDSRGLKCPKNNTWKGEKKTEVDDVALDDMIHRVLLSASMVESGDDSYGITDPFDGHVMHPDTILISLEQHHDKMMKERKLERKNKRTKKHDKASDKKRDSEVEECITDGPPPEESDPVIHITQGRYRRILSAELKNKARAIHEYYRKKWNILQDDRIDAYRGIIIWQDNCGKLEQELKACKRELVHLKLAYEGLVSEVEAAKKAKRTRRNAQKQRKTRQLNDKTVYSSNGQTSLLLNQTSSDDVICGASDDGDRR